METIRKQLLTENMPHVARAIAFHTNCAKGEKKKRFDHFLSHSNALCPSEDTLIVVQWWFLIDQASFWFVISVFIQGWRLVLVNQSNKLTLGCRGDAKPSAAQGLPSRRDIQYEQDGWWRARNPKNSSENSLAIQINKSSIGITEEFRSCLACDISNNVSY